MQPLRKKARPPAKKRHTKPCRFFQHDSCPLSAEECDFAHVLPNDVPLSSRSPCSYFSMGTCDNGSRCQFRHIAQASEGLGNAQNGATMPETDMSHDTHNPTAKRFAPWTMLFSPSMGGWGGSVYPGPMVSPVFPPSLPAPSNVYHHILRSRNNTKAVSNSNSTSSSFSDDVAFVTEDPNYSEHYHQYQSRIQIMDSPPLVHVPPFYHSPPDPHGPLSIDTSYIASPTMYNTETFLQPVSPSNLKLKARPRSSIRHKVINYKTKPCRFYKVDRTCPNGSSCTFIHTGTSPRESPATSPTLLPSLPTLPPKPLTLAEENKKKNFFPIPWRVIGGGVLMGSESTSITDHSSPNVGVVDKHEIVSEEREPRNISDRSPPKSAKRIRSSSIPPTPTIQHVDTGTLFSAESPGNL